jgi:FkbM family methyltransferase
MGTFRRQIGAMVGPLRRLAALQAQPVLVSEQSHSGAGEDRFVLAWLQVVYGLQDASKIRYCDIGAAHPKNLNNTFALYCRGASGVLVEPDPDQAAVLRQERPRDTVLNVGAAFDDRRSAKLKRFTARVFNTFSAAQANVVLESSKTWKPEQLQHVVDEVEIPLVPMNEILAKHFSEGPHFISIDTEGVDFSVLQSIDFTRFRPKMVCVEASRSPSEFDAFFNPHGYELIARSPDNLIYRLAVDQ